MSEILLQRAKSLQPEEIAQRIEQFDKELCNDTFLRTLKDLLPTPEQVRTANESYCNHLTDTVNQVGKLNVYKNADAEELSTLHPSDRFMVRLIKIDRLGPRIEGMLYKITFDENWTLIDDVCILPNSFRV